MRVVMVSGTPSISCGVADYTGRLIEALNLSGVEVHLLTHQRWGMLEVTRLLDYVRTVMPDVIHVQYPAAAYGAGLAPQTLTLLSRLQWPTVVTVHEFSRVHFLRRVAELPFALANHLFFTNPYEQTAFIQQVPWIKKKSSVVELGSSIPFWGRSPVASSLEGVYFGLIRENKGLEAFLELAQLCEEKASPYQFRIVGSIQTGAENYYQRMRQQSARLSNVVWELGLSAHDVAQRLSNGGFAYLPYPDGASERRTSLLAALGNGLPVITTKGPHTPESLDSVVAFASSAQDALKTLERWNQTPQEMEKLQLKAREYIRRFDWSYIARVHLEIYKKLKSPADK